MREELSNQSLMKTLFYRFVGKGTANESKQTSGKIVKLHVFEDVLVVI